MKTLTWITYLATLLSMALLGGCGLFGDDVRTGVFVSGTVVAQETGIPVEGMWITFGEVGFTDSELVFVVLTNAEGRFVIDYECEAGVYYILVHGDDGLSGAYVGGGNSSLRDTWWECTEQEYKVDVALEPKK